MIMTTMATITGKAMNMLDDFLIRALVAGVAVALAAGPLGCFVVWRRMAYFGDATAHAAILGVALALYFSVSVFAGILLTALAMALVVTGLAARGHAMDTALGVLAHSALALGLVGVSFVKGVRVDLSAFLFGDILAIGQPDLWFIWAGALVVLGLIVWRWSALLTSTIGEDLAFASGINPHRERLVLTIALALVVAVAIKLVGSLLISAMLIVPAAAARQLSRSPETMAIWAVLLGVFAVFGGLESSLQFDTPAGPGIVVMATVLFVLSLVVGAWRHRNTN